MQESPETTEAMDAMEKFLAGSTLELETLRQQTEASELTCQVLQASRYTLSSSDNDQFWELRAWPNRIQEVSVFSIPLPGAQVAGGLLSPAGLATIWGPVCGPTIPRGPGSAQQTCCREGGLAGCVVPCCSCLL